MGFTGRLGASNSQPGNIELGIAANLYTASASIAGASSSTLTAHVQANALTALTGMGAVSATADSFDRPAVSMSAKAVFFINPTKVTLIETVASPDCAPWLSCER